jgi:penicillin-binding protein 1A
MNYSKNEINKTIHQLKSRSRKISTGISVSGFRILLLIAIGLIVIGIFAGVGVLKGVIASSPSLENVNVIPEGYVTRFFYTDETVSQTLIGAGGNREYVSLDNVPDYVYNAFVAIEDERFWKHDGIDVRSILRAVSEVIKNRSLSTGASTITQQLLKNQVFEGGNETNDFHKLVRKIQEQYLAIQLESITDKKLILEYYLNTINLGQGCYGIEMASTTYFGKSAQDLTISEAAVLACIAQSPTRMNPYRHPEANMERRNGDYGVLKKMLVNEFITQEEYDAAIADTEDVYARINNYVSANSGRSYYSYFTDEVISHLMADLQELGYSASQASDMIYTGGLSVYTTQDREIQEIIDEVLNDDTIWPAIGQGSYYDVDYALSVLKKDGTTIHYQLYHFLDYFKYFEGSSTTQVRIFGGRYDLMTTNKLYIEACVAEFKNAMVQEGDTILGERFTETLEPQISFVMLDHSTGAIVGLSGGRGDKAGNRVLDRATDALRSVGSTFKVLAAYLPAFDTGTLTLASALDDSPYYYPDSIKKVNNWYGSNTYRGLNTTRLGISYSMNILACRTLERVTPLVAFDYLKDLGFTSLVEYKVGKDGKGYTDINYTLALGGLTNGVTNLELTAAYAAIANKGIYNKPYYYSKVLDHNGNVLIEHKPAPKQVMKNSTAFLLTSAMQDTLKKNIGTASIAAFQEYPMTLAGKSGTTSDNFDLWFEGYSPYYTAGIWEGFDISFFIKTTNTHEILWREIMERVHKLKALPEAGFEAPDSITTAEICTKCGKLAVHGLCDKYEGGNCIRTEYFAKGTVPTEYCDCHVSVKVCNKTGLIAQEGCTDYTEKVLLVKDEGEIWTPVDTDMTILSPTPTPHAFILPTATPDPLYTSTPTPTFTPTPTPTPEGYMAPETRQSMLSRFFELFRKLKLLLSVNDENVMFYTENKSIIDSLTLELTPVPSVTPVFISTKEQVIYTTSDTKYIVPDGYCYECRIEQGLVTATPSPFPTRTPFPTPTPHPPLTYDELETFLNEMQHLLNPSATPTPAGLGDGDIEHEGEGIFWYEGEGSGWDDGDIDLYTPTPVPVPTPEITDYMAPMPVPAPEAMITPTPTPYFIP